MGRARPQDLLGTKGLLQLPQPGREDLPSGGDWPDACAVGANGAQRRLPHELRAHCSSNGKGPLVAVERADISQFVLSTGDPSGVPKVEAFLGSAAHAMDSDHVAVIRPQRGASGSENSSEGSRLT